MTIFYFGRCETAGDGELRGNDMGTLMAVSIEPYREFILVLIGGLCATVGGIISARYQAKTARKKKMEETIGVQQVELYRKALSLIGMVRAKLFQDTLENTLKFMDENNSWFWDSQMFLPSQFSNQWRTIDLELRSLLRKKQSAAKDPGNDAKGDFVDQLEAFIGKKADKAEKDLRRRLKLKPIKVKRLKRPKR